MRLKVVFANVIQGMIHVGYNDKNENLFTGFHPHKYVEYFEKQQPDILCLAEVLMDTPDGDSSFVKQIAEACDFSYYHNLVGEKAFFVDDKFYGLSICSKFPFMTYQVQKLANPHIETIRPNGDHWVMHDKFIQKAILNLGKTKMLNLVNTHMFPFQHFNRHFWDEEFASYRTQWAKLLNSDNGGLSLIAGDFNTVGIAINKAFPELEIGKLLHSVVNYDGKMFQPRYPYDTQIEYILASSSVQVISAKAEMIYSDHPFLIAEIEL